MIYYFQYSYVQDTILEILSRETRRILAEKEVIKAIDRLLEDESIKEIEVALLNRKIIKVRRVII